MQYYLREGLTERHKVIFEQTLTLFQHQSMNEFKPFWDYVMANYGDRKDTITMFDEQGTEDETVQVTIEKLDEEEVAEI